ncbi:MAG: collagen-like protein, partial [Alphaproteobacteria bacterium]|nr:collagen-like protein [Alphaproteobacteria bacterium]
TLNTTTNYAGSNTAYVGGDVGYFVQQSGTGSLTVSIAKFVSTPLTQSVIPSGPWTFYNNIYSFTGPTGPQPWANPTGSGTPGKVYAIARYQDSITGGQLFKTGFSDVNLSDDTVVLNGNVLSPITLNGTGSFSVEYYAEQNTSGNVYEFWTQGNSVAFVNTSLGVANGTQGPTGAPGATGAQGPQGPQGPAGSIPNGTLGQLAYFSSTNTVSGTPNITTNGTNLSVLSGAVTASSYAGGSMNLAGNGTFGGLLDVISGAIVNSSNTSGQGLTIGGVAGVVNMTVPLLTQQNLQVVSASSLTTAGIINCAGPLTVVNQGINTPAILPGSLGSIGTFIDFTSTIGQASFVIAGWRFIWGRTPNVFNGGVCLFINAFQKAPVVLLSEFGSSNHSYSLGSVGITQFSIFHSDVLQLGFFFLAIGQA